MTGDSPFVRAGGELRATNRAQLELMRGVLERGLPFRFEALGFSMAPFVRHGDMLTVAPLNQRAPRAGDVIAFVQADSARLAVHRVIATQDGALIARGDNSLEADTVIPRANVLGIVTRVERDGRAVRLGLGRGGGAIAWLSARGRLVLFRRWIGWALRPAVVLLSRLQRLPRFRAWVKRFRPAFTIEKAKARDWIEVQARLNPGGDATPQVQMPGVTNYVARHGRRLLGFVQLVRHPPEHFPYVGHWLFSLVVWGRYRGMGVGEALARRVIAQASAEGAPELHLNVDARNHPALDLYRKLGFERVTLPALEQELIAEGQKSGRRTVTLRKQLPVSIRQAAEDG